MEMSCWSNHSEQLCRHISMIILAINFSKHKNVKRKEKNIYNLPII